MIQIVLGMYSVQLKNRVLLGRYIANISKKRKVIRSWRTISSDVEVYQIGELVLEQTPTPTQEELPSSISPSMWTDDEMLAQFNSSALPKYCAISMYAKDGKYYIASGTNKVGEPQSFEKAPIINWNLCDECVNQDHTQVFLID